MLTVAKFRNSFFTGNPNIWNNFDLKNKDYLLFIFFIIIFILRCVFKFDVGHFFVWHGQHLLSPFIFVESFTGHREYNKNLAERYLCAEKKF